jgi:AAA+ ATPase superfamily predicted ATPase
VFLGRWEELQYFEAAYKSSGAQLIIVYGRRRVGKTETLKEFAKNKKHIFYTCIECSDQEQLQSFSGRILAQDIPAGRYVSAFAGWRQALQSLEELPGSHKKLLIIDEFPYMARNNPSIPSILQDLWDSGLKEKNLMIVLCGSAMSFMEKEILAEKNPLYGRATGILKMEPLNFYDAIQFFPSWPDTDKTGAYAILGGIPHYLKQFDKRKNLGTNIREKILSRGSVLYNEVEFLMRQELRETAIYNTVIAAVALGNTRLNEIHNKTQIDKSKLAVYLKNLADLGVIRRDFSILDGTGTRSNVQRGIYRITDPFFRFWYAFVFPNMSELEAGDAGGVYKYIIAPALEEYVSRPFEGICREYLRRLNREGKLPFHFTRIGSFWDKTREIDIMACGQEKERLILGECKYRRSAFGLSDMMNAFAKYPAGESGVSSLTWFFFSRSGFTRDVKETAKARDDIKLVGLAEIVKGRPPV